MGSLISRTQAKGKGEGETDSSNRGDESGVGKKKTRSEWKGSNSSALKNHRNNNLMGRGRLKAGEERIQPLSHRKGQLKNKSLFIPYSESIICEQNRLMKTMGVIVPVNDEIEVEEAL